MLCAGSGGPERASSWRVLDRGCNHSSREKTSASSSSSEMGNELTIIRSHLPLLFIGMEHLQLSAVSIAKEYLLAAKEKFDGDPLLMNELGVVAYNENE